MQVGLHHDGDCRSLNIFSVNIFIIIDGRSAGIGGHGIGTGFGVGFAGQSPGLDSVDRGFHLFNVFLVYTAHCGIGSTCYHFRGLDIFALLLHHILAVFNQGDILLGHIGAGVAGEAAAGDGDGLIISIVRKEHLHGVAVVAGEGAALDIDGRRPLVVALQIHRVAGVICTAALRRCGDDFHPDGVDHAVSADVGSAALDNHGSAAGDIRILNGQCAALRREIDTDAGAGNCNGGIFESNTIVRIVAADDHAVSRILHGQLHLVQSYGRVVVVATAIIDGCTGRPVFATPL